MLISHKIKQARDFLSLPQDKFGSLFGLSRAIIRDYESGKTKPKRIFLDKLEALFNIPKGIIENDSVEIEFNKRPPELLIEILSLYAEILNVEFDIEVAHLKLMKFPIKAGEDITAVVDEQTLSHINEINEEINSLENLIKTQKNKFISLFYPMDGYNISMTKQNVTDYFKTIDLFRIIEIYNQKSK